MFRQNLQEHQPVRSASGNTGWYGVVVLGRYGLYAGFWVSFLVTANQFGCCKHSNRRYPPYPISHTLFKKCEIIGFTNTIWVCLKIRIVITQKINSRSSWCPSKMAMNWMQFPYYWTNPNHIYIIPIYIYNHT